MECLGKVEDYNLILCFHGTKLVCIRKLRHSLTLYADVWSHFSCLIQKGFAGVVPIFKTHIPRSIKVTEAVLYHKTICEYMPHNPAAVAYEKFADEFLGSRNGQEGGGNVWQEENLRWMIFRIC